MAIEFDPAAVVNDLLAVIQKQAKSGWQVISAFVSDQSRRMAIQAKWIAESSISGDLKDDPDLQKMFTDALADSVLTMAHDVAALTILTVEKVWNAAVGVLWGAINKALSSAGLGLFAMPAF